MTSRLPTSATLTAAALLAACGLAHAGEPVLEVIYTKIPTHPTSIVPGARDLAGNPVETRFRAFEDFILSPDGSRWALRGRNQLGTDLETMVLMGSGTSGDMFLQEGHPVPGATAPTELVDFFGSGFGRFNDLNQFALSLRTRGGASATAQKIVVWDGANFSIPFQQGSLLVGLIDVATNPSGDETFGNSVGSIHLLNDGRIGSQDSTIGNIHTSRRPALFYDNVAFMQANVTTVADLDGIGIVTLDGFTGNGFYTSPDGAQYVALASIVADASIDDVLVNEGRVVIQQGFPVAPGHPAIVNTIVTAFVTSNGDWYARGTIAGGGVWAVRNGEVLAATGDPILPGSTEHWGSTFLALTANRNGDWVLIGTTDNPDPGRDTVAVLNGEMIIAREGDGVDLDGNGILDDDVFIGRGNNTLSAFEPDDVAISPDRTVYFIANIRDGAGNDLNSDPAFGAPQALLRLVLGGGEPPCPADWDGNGTVNSTDISAFLTAWLDSLNNQDLNADFDGNGTVNSSDISAFLTAWLDAVQNGC
jgi:hypothetical protein